MHIIAVAVRAGEERIIVRYYVIIEEENDKRMDGIHIGTMQGDQKNMMKQPKTAYGHAW